MDALVLLSSVLGVGFLSGINLYATVLLLGLAVRIGFVDTLPGFTHLEVLGHPAVLVTAGGLYLIEFVADKIPYVDSSWDAIHTVIRPVGAAALAAGTLGGLDPATETALVLACGGLALSSHSAKATTRVAANHSPEPFSNIALSVAEDVAVLGGLWLLLVYPLVALCAVVVFLGIFVWIFPKILRALRASFRRIRSLVSRREMGDESAL
ncbi:MAG: DUF4126 domain-containing protein [Candidatus Hydrogenedentes bacterium]|nr:DUF4126 domain-containing protein [Candidatus Hydrogenedentota bacterium]